MRITVFGAAGGVGSRVVTEALGRGHEVTAVVRRPGHRHDGARVRTGDAADAGQVARLGAGQDVVVAATRPAPGREHELAATAEALLAGVARTGMPPAGARLLIVGGAATLTVPGAGGGTVVDAPDFPAVLRPIALACAEQLAVCRAAGPGVDWTYLSPPALLEPGERTGAYRTGTDTLLVDDSGRSAISMEDFAVALLDEAERPAHHRTRFTVAW
jgi:putative NADH-flavin reductase